MIYSFETFRDDKVILVLQPRKMSHLSIMLDRFYESPRLKNRMCELYTFSIVLIWSHIAVGELIFHDPISEGHMISHDMALVIKGHVNLNPKLQHSSHSSNLMP